MPSLHDNGWRQGTVFEADLVASSYVYSDGVPKQTEQIFAKWVVTSQDCDLASAESDDDSAVIEILPVLEGNGGGSWGLRSRTLRLAEALHTDARLPKVRISPAALSVFLVSANVVAAERAVAFKTWLGLRYDRPAVPEVLVELARAIAAAIRETRTTDLSAVTHDVLFAAREAKPTEFELIGVVTDAEHAEAVQMWLASAALKVDPTLGTLAGEPLALTKDTLTMSDVENTFSADLSDITWGKVEPRGAI